MTDLKTLFDNAAKTIESDVNSLRDSVSSGDWSKAKAHLFIIMGIVCRCLESIESHPEYVLYDLLND